MRCTFIQLDFSLRPSRHKLEPVFVIKSNTFNKLRQMAVRSLKTALQTQDAALVYVPHGNPLPCIYEDEIAELSKSVIRSHSPQAVSLACLSKLTQSALSAGGLSHLIALQSECIRTYMRVNRISDSEFDSALDALGRAGRTAEYLGSLPA